MGLTLLSFDIWIFMSSLTAWELLVLLFERAEELGHAHDPGRATVLDHMLACGGAGRLRAGRGERRRRRPRQLGVHHVGAVEDGTAAHARDPRRGHHLTLGDLL